MQILDTAAPKLGKVRAGRWWMGNGWKKRWPGTDERTTKPTRSCNAINACASRASRCVLVVVLVPVTRQYPFCGLVFPCFAFPPPQSGKAKKHWQLFRLICRRHSTYYRLFEPSFALPDVWFICIWLVVHAVNKFHLPIGTHAHIHTLTYVQSVI